MAWAIARTLAVSVVTVAAACGALYLFSPPKALDVLNSLTPGDGGVIRIGGDIPFLAGARGELDIWSGAPAATPKPVVIFFYGGGWVKGRRQDYGFAAKAYAARGFVVVVPDYRLVPDIRFPVFLQDAAAAVRWTHDHIARFGGDPNRIVLAGHSAGAYLAVMLALDPRYLTATGVDPKIVRAAAGLAGPYDFYPFDARRSIDAMGQAPDPLETQPIHFARADAPPLWLATGTADTEVRPRNAVNLAAREWMLGNRTTILREYPGLTHNDLVKALSKPFRRTAPILEESIAFFNAALRQSGNRGDPGSETSNQVRHRPAGERAGAASAN